MNAPDWHLNPRVQPATEPVAPSPTPTGPAPRARYDAARTGSQDREHWKHADALSANAAANARDRWILRQRARYEVANNSFANGAANSLADDAIGTGPRLQLILDDIDEEKVRAVENLWQTWCDETRLGDTLRIMYRAQCVDGEGVALAVDNPRLDHPVKLQLRELECDRLTDPGGISLTIVSMNPGRVDGIHFDSAGNPTRYTILRHHPGDLLAMPLAEWDEYPASQVYHLFRADRPGQARGVSWLTPALPLFAQLRRYTLAVISAAETAASIAGVLHTTAPATGEGDAPTIETMDQVPIPRNALLTLPNEWQATSFQGDQPQQTFGDFRTQILVEIGRALDMPLNRITGNSSGYNYSSGRLDHLGYQRGVWQQRDRLRLIILDRLFRAWYDEALLAGAIPSGLPPMSEWAWDWQWDAFGDIDPSKEAKAAGQLLELNLTDLAEQCAARGRRWDQVLRQRAREMELMEELGLPMPTDKAVPEAPAGQTLEEMAAAAGFPLSPLACGGEGSGVPGPCPGGGEGEDKSGGGHTETHDKWDREDVDQEAERDDKIGEAQDRYDAVEEKIADKEDVGNTKLADRHERENDKVDRAQEKEDRGVERERNKEDRQDDKNDKATEKANEQQRAQELDDAEKAGASDGDMEKIGEKWDAKDADDLDKINAREDAKEASREKEDTDRADAREKEAAQREARHEAEQKEHDSKIEQERAANESQHEKETAEIERRFEKDKADSQAQREKDNPDAAREYYKKDKAGANAPRELAHV